jgi:hypothetical protein
MKTLCLAAGILVGYGITARPAEDMVAVRSHGGGQFIVHGAQADLGVVTTGSVAPTGARTVRLDPSLLVVTCDRVKRALMRELDCPDRWRGKIHIYIRPMAASAPVSIESLFYSDAWQGRMTVPAQIEASKLVRALVQVLLLEVANRVPGQYTSEIPLWLSEGLTQVLVQGQGPGLVLEGYTRTVRVETRVDPLAAVRARMTNIALLTFNELSYPGPGLVASDRWPSYADTACLLVYELGRLPNGRARLLDFVTALPRHLNWQTAFFKAFSGVFQQPLDVEKWWALAAANLAGRESGLTWSSALSMDKLDAALRVPVQVRHAADLLPLASSVSLQEFLEQWSYETQGPWIQQKVSQLRWLEMNVSPAVAPLVGAYATALEDYLRKRRLPAGTAGHRKATGSQPQVWIQSAMEKLNQLDQVRLNWRTQSKSSLASHPAP